MSSRPPPLPSWNGVPQWYKDKIRHDQKLARKAGTPAQKPKKGQKTKNQNKKKGWAPGLFQSIGAGVGGWSGIPGGSELGRRAGQWFADITGSGAYAVNSNSLLNMGNQIPMFKNNSGSTRLRHREFITDINSYTNFTELSYAINPGLQQSFPWLSQIASYYEQYRFHGLIYEFKSTSANALNSTNTALGTIIMATEYDVLDVPFTNKQQMEAYEFSSSCKPSDCMIHPVECDPRQTTITELYVRSTAPLAGSNSDLRFHDLGNFQIAGVGSQAVAVVGELWVSYDVEFFKPKIITPLGADLLYTHIRGSLAANLWFGSAQVVAPSSTIVLTTGASNTLTFPSGIPGRYLIVLSAETGTTTFTGGVAGSTGLVVLTAFNNNTNFYIGSGSGTGVAIIETLVDCPLSGGTITFNTPTITGTPVYDLFVSQVSAAVL